MVNASNSEGVYTFALTAPLAELPSLLRAAFCHPWVESYQVGFGPPLVRATPALTEAARQARSALDKLDAYLAHTILDESTRVTLAERQRHRLARSGPVEAEALTAASILALDLVVRLYSPASAPHTVLEEMSDAGLLACDFPSDLPPEKLSGRFVVRIDDPANRRLFHHQALRGDTAEMALEFHAAGAFPQLWSQYFQQLARSQNSTFVELGAPAPHAKVTRDGVRR